MGNRICCLDDSADTSTLGPDHSHHVFKPYTPTADSDYKPYTKQPVGPVKPPEILLLFEVIASKGQNVPKSEADEGVPAVIHPDAYDAWVSQQVDNGVADTSSNASSVSFQVRAPMHSSSVYTCELSSLRAQHNKSV